MTHEPKPSRSPGFGAAPAVDGDAPPPLVVALPSTILALVAVLVGLDVASDARAGGSTQHLVLEIAIMAVALAGTVALWGQLFLARRRARALHRDLVRAEADLTRFREESRDHSRGLSEAIDRQLARWGLSAAEREVALLLLKGLALKEIAQVRDTSERTVRQQALAVYRKAGLGGRAELSAFFLEDLLSPPAPAREGARPAGGSAG